MLFDKPTIFFDQNLTSPATCVGTRMVRMVILLEVTSWVIKSELARTYGLRLAGLWRAHHQRTSIDTFINLSATSQSLLNL